MHRTPEARCVPSTLVLVSNCDACEHAIRNTLAESPRWALTSDLQCTVEAISKLKIQSDNYSEANPCTCKTQELGYTSEVEGLVASRLKLVHRDAFEAVEILNNRLRVLGEDACSSLHTKGSIATLIVHDDNVEEAQLCTQLESNDHPGENPPPSNELGAHGGAKPARPKGDDLPQLLKPIFPRLSPNHR